MIQESMSLIYEPASLRGTDLGVVGIGAGAVQGTPLEHSRIELTTMPIDQYLAISEMVKFRQLTSI